LDAEPHFPPFNKPPLSSPQAKPATLLSFAWKFAPPHLTSTMIPEFSLAPAFLGMAPQRPSSQVSLPTQKGKSESSKAHLIWSQLTAITFVSITRTAFFEIFSHPKSPLSQHDTHARFLSERAFTKKISRDGFGTQVDAMFSLH
jgi:hypothetical protein